MTPRKQISPESLPCIRTLGEETPEGRYEVGPTETRLAPLHLINMVSQVRQEYDPGQMEELERVMITESEDGEKKIELIQPITVGFFHRNDLAKYLDRLNDTWCTNHSIEELTPVPESRGQYFLLVLAGHRRTIAVKNTAEKLGIDPSTIDVTFHVIQGDELTFRNGIRTQYRENFHSRPESWEDATAITAIFSEGLKHQDYKTYADCAVDLGITPERVSKAYKFIELPSAVQEMVQDKRLAYGAASAIHALAVALAYNRGMKRYSEGEAELFVQNFYSGKALLQPALDRLTKKEVGEWERDLINLHILSKHIREKAVTTIEKYVEEQCTRLIEVNNLQLSMVNQNERLLEAAADRKATSIARSLLRGALRNMLDVLESDRARIANGRKPIMEWTETLVVRAHKACEATEALASGIFDEPIEELYRQIEDGAIAARDALQEIYDQEAALQNEPDFMNLAMGQDSI